MSAAASIAKLEPSRDLDPATMRPAGFVGYARFCGEAAAPTGCCFTGGSTYRRIL